MANEFEKQLRDFLKKTPNDELFKSNSFLKDLKEYYEKSEKTIFVEKRFIGLLVEFLNQISFPIQEWFKIYEYCKIHNLEKEAFEILGGLKK